MNGTRFRIALSVEMEKSAHQTLQLRAFRRQFEEPPEAYWELLRGRLRQEELFERFQVEAEAARHEAQQITLSSETAPKVRDLVARALGGRKNWVLIGGPPCQAYSLVGRSRNRGRTDYDADQDHRHVLYLEYLQLLAEHAPPVFVMENVKGLLSAKYRDGGMFERISRDLQNPAEEIVKVRGGVTPNPQAAYRILPLAPATLGAGDVATDFLVRSEEFGIPQARHRVIIVGVRADLDVQQLRLDPAPQRTVEAAIGDLPRLRSGVTDSSEEWPVLMKAVLQRDWVHELEPKMQKAALAAVKALKRGTLDRGGEFVAGENHECQALGGWCNHSTRAHIFADLERYLFASCYSAVRGRPAKLSDFPAALLPDHANVERALATGHFGDRFRVQHADRPATTVTSHISKDGHYYIHYDPTQCRSLTVREAARLQTFPDDYFFCGPRTAQYQQVGNAVPPALARQIAALILPLLA